MRLNRRVPVGTHGGVRGRLSIYESLLLDCLEFVCFFYPANLVSSFTLE